MAEVDDAEALRGNRLERLVALPSSSAVALLIVDDDRQLIEVNSAACGMLGVSRAELIGRRLDSLIAPAMRERLDNVWAAFRDQRGHAGPFELVSGDGAGRTVDIGVSSGVLPGRHLVLLAGPGERIALIAPRLESRETRGRPPTSREREVLALLAGGETDGQIARRLSLSPATVQTHVRNAKTKLGARTRAQAVALALRQGLISVGL
jgi:PAS domain S-box-containing protein